MTTALITKQNLMTSRFTVRILGGIVRILHYAQGTQLLIIDSQCTYATLQTTAKRWISHNPL